MNTDDETRIRITTEEANAAPTPIPVAERVSEIAETSGARRRPLIWITIIICLIACCGIVLVFTFPQITQVIQTFTKVIGSPDAGLTRDQLLKASPQILGRWVKSDNSTELSWACSSCVFQQKPEGRLWLATNLHCFGFEKLGASDQNIDDASSVYNYSLIVKFPGGKTKPVLRFAPHAGDIDLALLEVDAGDLVEGRDYVSLPLLKEFSMLNSGDAVVAAGSPYGLFGTQTFGRISAIRPTIVGSIRCRTIQVDAAINEGNSGGPLFLQSEDRFLWIGINTQVQINPSTGTQAQGIGFAIHVSEVLDSQYMWRDVDSQGDVEMIRKFRQAPVKPTQATP